jgi:hypothetical protein
MQSEVKSDAVKHAEIIIKVRNELIKEELNKIRAIIDNWDSEGPSYINLSMKTDYIKTLVTQRDLAAQMIEQHGKLFG